MVVALPTVEDVPELFQLIEIYSQTGIIIKRSSEEITKNINNFRVVKDSSKVVGCVSLFIYSSDLAELRTLIVAPDYHGRGIGSLLVERVKKWSQELKVSKLFTLTTQVTFFQRHGFHIIEKSLLPEKIFKDCQHCHYQNDCQETALWMTE